MMRLDLMVSSMEVENRSNYTLLPKKSLVGSGSGEMMNNGWDRGLLVNEEGFRRFLFILAKGSAGAGGRLVLSGVPFWDDDYTSFNS